MTAPQLARASNPATGPYADTTVHVIGAGPIGRALLCALDRTPYRVTAVSDTSGTLFDRNGLDARWVAEQKAAGRRVAGLAGARDGPLPSLLLHGATDVVVDCTASDSSRDPGAVERAMAALDAEASVVFAAKHALGERALAFLEPTRAGRIRFNAVLGGTGLALLREHETL